MCSSRHLRSYTCPLSLWFHYSCGGQFLPVSSTLPQAYAALGSCFSASGLSLTFQKEPLVYHMSSKGNNASGGETSTYGRWGKYCSFTLVGPSWELSTWFFGRINPQLPTEIICSSLHPLWVFLPLSLVFHFYFLGSPPKYSTPTQLCVFWRGLGEEAQTKTSSVLS